MRTMLFLVCVASLVLACSALPLREGAPLCPSLPVQLELRGTRQDPTKYKLVFAAIDPQHSAFAPDFVDIHYRVNNEDSTNLRVLTQTAITDNNLRAKQAQVDNIELQAGDVLRAYATYQAKGYACDTPMHTFNAPEEEEDINQFGAQAYYDTDVLNPWALRYVTSPSPQQDMRFTTQAMLPRRARRAIINEEDTKTGSVCPSIIYDEDVYKIKGLRDTYLLQFENKNPLKQLHYVDLHVATDADAGWDNLRLASDMQLNLAHKVMQPGIVVKPDETLHWYWSYRTVDRDNQIVDCTTPINSLLPHQVTREIDLRQFERL